MAKKNEFPLRGAIGGCVLVFVVWLACKRQWFGLNVEADELSALFTGLGFVGVVAAFLHERKQAEEADADHAQLIHEMRTQSLVSLYNARITAIKARLEIVDEDLGKFRIVGCVPSDKVRKRKDELDAESYALRNQLRKLSEEYPAV